jgi:uncharacterized RDD family membrane protein YckC
VSDINPYAPPISEVRDSDPSDANQFTLADRGTRLGAILLDGLILMVPVFFLLWLFYGAFGAQFWVPVPGAKGVLLSLGAIAIGAIVDLAVNGILLFRHGQSVGKRICKIRIAKLNGEVPSLLDSYVKRRVLFSVVQKIPLVGVLLGLADALMIFRDDRRCIHDHVAGTIVINT